MSLQKQNFVGFSPAMFEQFALKIKTDTGVVIEGDSGTVQHGSFVFQYSYDPTADA